MKNQIIGSEDYIPWARKATPEEKQANERALNRMKKLFPSLSRKDTVGFLISCTAFPFNSIRDAVDQAAELSKLSHKSVERAYIESDRIMDRAMRKCRIKYPEFFADTQ